MMKKYSKFALFTFALFLSFLINSKMARADVVQDKDRHFVFMIHGIGGHTTDFGSFEEAFLSYNHRLKTNQEFFIKKFSYDTGNDTKNVDTFALDLSVYIKETIKNFGGLRPTDKISFVMHSQGGLIGMNFLFGTFAGHKDFYPEAAEHIDSYITMSTPYGGTKIASLVSLLKPIKGVIIPYLLSHFGKKELEDMSFGSDFTLRLRSAIIDPKTSEIYKAISNKVRILQISGVVEKYNIIPLFSNGLKFYDSDFAVAAPSSRLDFIYNSSATGEFKKTSLIKDYYTVSAFHFSILKNRDFFNGISDVPPKCIDILPQDCSNKAFRLIAPFLLRESFEAPPKKALTNFAIDIHVKFNGKVIDPKKLSIQLSEMPENDEDLDFNRKGDVYGKVERWSGPQDYRYYTNGYFEDEYGAKQARVGVRITAPGFKSYRTTALVERGTGTFIDVALQKE